MSLMRQKSRRRPAEDHSDPSTKMGKDRPVMRVIQPKRTQHVRFPARDFRGIIADGIGPEHRTRTAGKVRVTEEPIILKTAIESQRCRQVEDLSWLSTAAQF